jgi:hypothetical protein
MPCGDCGNHQAGRCSICWPMHGHWASGGRVAAMKFDTFMEVLLYLGCLGLVLGIVGYLLWVL